MTEWLRTFLEQTDSAALNAWWTNVTVAVAVVSFVVSHSNLFIYISRIKGLGKSRRDHAETFYGGDAEENISQADSIVQRFQRSVGRLLAAIKGHTTEDLMRELQLEKRLEGELQLWRDCQVEIHGTTRSTYDPARVFEWQELGAKQYNRYAVLLWPAVLIGLGILGTFIGLMQGIQSLDTGSETLASDVRGLLGGVALAFESSIWGISLSLLWNFGHRIVYWLSKLHTDRACEYLRHYSPSWTVERLNAELMREQGQQTSSLKSLGTDFAFKIGEVLHTLLEQHSGKPLRELSSQMQAYTERVAELQNRGFDEIASKVGDAVAGIAGQEIEALADTIRELNYLHRQSHDSYKDLMSTLAEQVSMYSELVQRFASVSKDLDAYAETLKDSEERSRLQLEENREAIGEMTSALEQIRDLHQGVQQGQEAINAQLSQLRETWEDSKGELSDLAGKVENAAGNFGEDFVATLQRVHTQIEKLLVETLSQFSGTLAGVREVMETDVVSLLDGLQQTLTRIDGTLKDSIPPTLTSFDASVQRIDKSLAALEPALRRLSTGNEADQRSQT